MRPFYLETKSLKTFSLINKRISGSTRIDILRSLSNLVTRRLIQFSRGIKFHSKLLAYSTLEARTNCHRSIERDSDKRWYYYLKPKSGQQEQQFIYITYFLFNNNVLKWSEHALNSILSVTNLSSEISYYSFSWINLPVFRTCRY